MLGNYPVNTTVPVSDLDRAVNFYENKLGLKRVQYETGEESAMFEAGNGTRIYLYKRGTSKADHTLAAFEVDDIKKVMEDLEVKGVEFEHYDMPGLKTDELGIAEMGGAKSAWFKDPDGNIFGIVEM